MLADSRKFPFCPLSVYFCPFYGVTPAQGETTRRSRQSGQGGAVSETWVTDHKPEIERTPTFWTLEEHRYRFWSALRRQPPRCAVVQIGREAVPVQFRTAEVERPSVRPEHLAAFVREVRMSHGCYVPAEIAARRIDERAIVVPPATGPGRAGNGRRRAEQAGPAHHQAAPVMPVPRDEADPFATDE